MGYTKLGATMNGNMKGMIVMRWDNNIPAKMEVIYKDKDMTEIKAVFYEQVLVQKMARKFIGDDIEWCDDKNFKVLNNGKYVDEGDEEDKHKYKCFIDECEVIVYGRDLYCDDCLEALEEQNDEEEEEEVSEC